MNFTPPPRKPHSVLATALLVALLAGLPAGAQEAEPPPEPQPAAPAPQPPVPAEPAPGAPAPAPEPAPGATATPGEAAAPPGQTPAPPAEAKPPNPNRIQFTLQLEDGKGTVTGDAGSLEFQRQDYAVLTGEVEVHYKDLKLTADRAEVDLHTRKVTAEGNVVLDQGPRRLAGKTLTFDLDTKTGSLSEATAFVDPDYYFSGREIAKVGDDVYTVTDGVFTSCDQKTPDWSFRLGQARVEVEGYAHVKNARMRIKKLPVLYTPYIVWPTKRERSAGLLVPNIGWSQRRGSYLGLAYFQPLGRSYDTTVFLDGYSKGYVGLGDELRYQPTEGTKGKLQSYAIQDQEQNRVRWKAQLEHESNDLPLGLRGVVDWTEYSDFQFFQDFERDFNLNSARFQESKAFLTGNWGTHLVNFQVTNRETFSGSRINTDRRLPELDYNLRSTPILQTGLWDAPLYLTLDSSAGLLSVDRSNTYHADYTRLDLYPQLSYPLQPAPWLSLTLNAGQRLTWYGDSLETNSAQVAATGSAFSGDTLTRNVSIWGAQLIGPSFSRIFDAKVGPYVKLKHVIEPRITYTYGDSFQDATRVPSFDSVDRTFAGNVVRYSLTNRIKAKPSDESGGAPQEVFSLELAQSYSFDDTRHLDQGAESLVPGAKQVTSQRSPISADLRFNPTENMSLRGQWEYSTLFKQLTSSAVAANYKFGAKGANDVDLRLTTRFRAQDGEIQRNQLRLAAGFAVIPTRLTVQTNIDYDLDKSKLQEQRYFLSYTSQCYGIRLEYRDFQAGTKRDTDYRIAFTLKNVGTFLDLTGRVQQ